MVAGAILKPILGTGPIRRVGVAVVSTGTTLVIPGDMAPGDIMVHWDQSNQTFGTPSSVVPSGFTNLQETTTPNVTTVSREVLSYKIATDADRGATLTGLSGTNNNKMLVLFRWMGRPIAAVTGSTFQNTHTNGNPGGITMTPAAGSQSWPWIFLGAYACEAHTFSGAADIETQIPDALNLDVGTGGADVMIASRTGLSAPPTQVLDMADLGNHNAVHAGFLHITG